MFHLTRKTDYGLILMLELARQKNDGNQAPISLNDIAKKYCISFFFLQKVAKDLREKGLIKASRGKIGGYSLTEKTPNLNEIFTALEGSVAIMSCFAGTSSIIRKNTFGLQKKCQMPAHKGLGTLNTQLADILTKTSLQDFF
jgi:Rrf2 family protein